MTTDQLATIDSTELDPTIFGGPVEQDQGNFPVVVSYCVKGISGTSANKELSSVKAAIEFADGLRKGGDYSISFLTKGHPQWGINTATEISEEILREQV